jgi:hypothetical protein
MANIEIRVGSIGRFAHGRGFGEAGPYLRMREVARGELDPAAPRRARSGGCPWMLAFRGHVEKTETTYANLCNEVLVRGSER